MKFTSVVSFEFLIMYPPSLPLYPMFIQNGSFCLFNFWQGFFYEVLYNYLMSLCYQIHGCCYAFVFVIILQMSKQILLNAYIY